MTQTTEQSNALAKRQSEQAVEQRSAKALTLEMVVQMTGYDLAEVAMIRHNMATSMGKTPDEVNLYDLALFCRATKSLQLDPLLKQAYWIVRDGKGGLQTGIDGFRAIAERSGLYAGSEPPVFRGWIDQTYVDGNKQKAMTVPEKASVTVWKIVAGHKAAFTGEAYWTEFYPGDRQGFMWRKMPRHMLAKCAESQALRKAFPAQLGSVQMAPDFETVDGGELPEVNPPQRIVEQPARVKPSATAADYDRIIGSQYDDEDLRGLPVVPAGSARDSAASAPSSEAPASVEMVKTVRSAPYQELAGLIENAAAGGIDVEPFKITLPAPLADVQARIKAAQVAIDAASETEPF